MTALKTTSTTTHLTGALSGTGHDLVRATVYTGNVPLHPPAELADAIHPVYDSRGDLQDWRLGSLKAGHHLDNATWARFREWRARFAQDRFLSERALVRSFLDWLEPRCDTSALGVLRLPSSQVDFHTALKMKAQIEAADRAVTAAREDGLGLYSAGNSRSAVRVLIPTASPTLLLRLNETTLTVSLEGLSLQTPHPQLTLRTITGWRANEDGLSVVADGRNVDITARDTATLLLAAGRQAPQIDIRYAPLRTLMAPVLTFLRDAATLSGTTGADLHFRSGRA